MTGGTSGAKVPAYARAVVAIPVALFAWFCTMVPQVAGGASLYWEVRWLPQQGIALGFHVDGLALLFALLITGIGSFILLYASEYMRGQAHVGRFTAFLVSFMLAMLGLVLSDNLVGLFVFWELTAVTSFLLIGYSHEEATARRAALQGLLVTGAGALAMLAGFVLLGEAAGTYSLREMLAGAGLADHPSYAAILALVLAGAFTKSAQFPFHFWLPNAMAAPTPVSAYLHSATMVKAGVFLLARVSPILGGTAEWAAVLTGVGAFTAVYSAAVALTRTDLKQVLAYSTVMALGTCVMFIGLPPGDGFAPGALAAVTAVFVHALYKAALFMAAGTIDRATGTRDLRALGGLGRAMPLTFAASALASLSMAGAPPFLGFLGKEMLYSTALDSPAGLWAVAAVFLASAMIVTVALLVGAFPFAGRRETARREPREGRWPLWVGSLTLGACALIGGLWAPAAFDSLLLPAASAVAGRGLEFHPHLWPGMKPEVLLSAATLAVGVIVYWRRAALLAGLGRALALIPVTGDRSYDASMAGIARLAAWHTRWVQCGTHRRYILVVFGTLGVGLAAAIAVKGVASWPTGLPGASAVEWTLAAMIAASALVTIRARSRLLAICALGVVGTGAALVFALYGAPDVALTQLMVETLVVVIVAMVLLKLPDFRGEVRQTWTGRWRDGIVAVTVGLAITLVLLAVLAEPKSRDLTAYFERTALPEGFGRNVVNVILVDFRGLDTLGEITVLAVASMAGFALIRWRAIRPARRAAARAEGRP